LPAGGLTPGTIEPKYACALSGDALKVEISLPEASLPEASAPAERSGAAAGRSVAVVYLWGIQAPRPSQPSGEAAMDAAAQLYEGKSLAAAARSAGPEVCITGSVVAGDEVVAGEEDVGRALVRRGLTWQDQRGPSSAQLRALEREARRQEVGLWQQDAPAPPWAWGG
jgi:Staphylococcal nuclease homologue.